GWHWGFMLAGVGMLIGMATYLGGSRYLPKGNGPIAKQERPAPTQKIKLEIYILLLAVILIVVIFRASYEQSGNTLALWADSGVDRRIGGFMIPMTWFQSLNPLMIFLFTPLIVAYWSRRARAGREPGSVSKMGMGALIVGGSYLILAAVAALGAPASWLWVV